MTLRIPASLPASLRLGFLAALAAVLPTRADPPEMRFRGTVERADGDHLTVRRPGGSTVTMRMNPRTRILAATPAEVRQIKPESYVSVFGRDGADPARAEAVTIFSPSERGLEAGRRPWDGTPGAVLVGGWITQIGGRDPRRLTLAYDGGQAAVEIPRGTPVTQVAPGEKALLVPGAAVTAITHTAAGGNLEAGTVVVGRLGAVPSL